MKGALIGAGYFAQFHAEAWQRLQRTTAVEIIAVVDPAPGKASGFAKSFHIPRAYDSPDQMLVAEHPDFVDIITRPESHLVLTTLAAHHGAHVICQKPMAPTLAECEAMCETCEKANVRLLIHENWRWQPWYREVKRLIDSGELGALRHLSFDWRTGDGNGPEPYPAQPYFREMPRLLIYESLIHILDTFRFLAGEFRITRCETRRINPVIAGEDWADIHLAFTNAATGFIHGDRHTGPVPPPIAMGTMKIEGARSTLRISPDGHLHLSSPDTPEHPTNFAPPIIGYKGDSVFATQQHLLHSLFTNTPAETEARGYLGTMSLVEDCYRSESRGTTTGRTCDEQGLQL